MTIKDARREAERIVERYVNCKAKDVLPDYLVDVYNKTPFSAFIDKDVVIDIFTERIFTYNTPLAKAMSEE